MRWPTSARVAVSLLVATVAVSVGFNGYLLTKKPAIEGPIFVVPEELVGLAQANFPSEYVSGVPDGQELALVLDSVKAVKNRAKVTAAVGDPLDVVLKRAFPLLKIDSQTTSGSACFPAESGKHGKFCVIFAASHSF